jgi:fatty-acyl-CoA synthase
MLWRHPDFARTDLSCFRFMISGAAPISRLTMEAYWQKGVNIMNAYGMTEVGPSNISPPLCVMSPEDIREKWDAAGIPMPFNHCRIVDEEGRDAAIGERGELIFRGLLTFSGYWRDAENTRKIVRDGWVYTGDIACRDEDGYIRICGRKKNMYISGGENIYPVEIEHVLMDHPAVEYCCVFGVPDDRWGEVGKALIVRRDKTVTKEALRSKVAQRSAKLKAPKYIEFVDAIPKNAAGKTDMKKVLERYGARSDE